MKKLKKLSIVLLMVVVLLTSGCTRREIDKESGQAYIKNVFCKPTDSELISVYEKNKIDISNLPDCQNFNLKTGGYEGLWTSFFVKPLSFLILKLGNLVNKSYGLAVIFIGLIIRALMIPMTKNTAMQSENMKKAQPELKRLEKKYENKTDQQSMVMKSQEMMAIYNKYNIKPLGGCLFAFIQLPIFMAFIEAIYRVPAFFEESFLGLKLGTTASQGITQGNYYYLIVVLLIVAATYVSFKGMNTTAMDEAQEKQMKTMYIVMLVMMGIASFQLPVAIALYWVTSSIFTIVQNYIIRKTMKKEVN